MHDIQRRYEKVLAQTTAIHQAHVLKFWSQLGQAEKIHLLEQLEALDFGRIDHLAKEHVLQEKDVLFVLPEKIEPAPCYPAEPRTDKQKRLYTRAWKVGEKALREGKVCAFTVAGGMGTRLGFDGPKGCFQISPVQQKTLFQLFAETIAHCKRRYNPQIRWFIMTSQGNHRATVDFFKRNAFFGLPEEHLVFFQQGMMPAFSPDGKLLLDQKHSLSLSPDGHGGSLRALRQSGALDEMKRLGIEHISYFQVDNPLVRLLDPHFIGLHLLSKSDMSSKSIPKSHDKEKVGVFVLGDATLTVIEYSDLPDELATRKNTEGSRMFDAGSIAIHIISRDFAERITDGDLQLPYHRAVKKVPFVDESGRRIEPEKPNGVKLEQFVFDAIPLATNPIVVETVRDEEFSPVKNESGPDSPDTCRRDLIQRAIRWLERADVYVGNDNTSGSLPPVEISPLRAIFPEDLTLQ